MFENRLSGDREFGGTWAHLANSKMTVGKSGEHDNQIKLATPQHKNPCTSMPERHDYIPFHSIPFHSTKHNTTTFLPPFQNNHHLHCFLHTYIVTVSVAAKPVVCLIPSVWLT
ncbi:hypothetical protein L6452_01566 [Arctium lappa]|uniref:Uncharacterized protein n=1 Tax=Arctium lappa TaxID=4217 RepID=A0ACB9FI20_ARCLA|nr:hypothetical protein L6452_01566 [Arctium lappa]